ncbi:MAG: extracellular solute-binding protein [Actinomycetota bacterium]
MAAVLLLQDSGSDTPSTAASAVATTTITATTATSTSTSAATEPTTTSSTSTTTTTFPLIELPDTPIVVWVDELRGAAIRQAAATFRTHYDTPITVEIVDYYSVKAELLAQSDHKTGPDLFYGDHSWMNELVAAGLITPIDVRGRESEFIPTALDAVRVGENQYGLPVSAEAVALAYNTDLVPVPPATMSDLVDSCTALPIDKECLLVRGGGDRGDAYSQQPFLAAYGGHIFGYSPETGYDGSDVRVASPETIRGAQLLEDLVRSGHIPSTNYSQARELFVGGDAAFWITGPWEINILENPGGNTNDVNWSVAALPTVDGGVLRPHVNVQGFFLHRDSGNPLAAEEFLHRFVFTPGTLIDIHFADHRGSTMATVLDSVSGNPIAAAFTASVMNGLPQPTIREMQSTWGPIADALLAIRNGTLPAEVAMWEAHRQIVASLGG